MPAKVVKRGGKYRISESATGKLMRNRGGTVVSKGFRSKRQAARQARAINASLHKRGKI